MTITDRFFGSKSSACCCNFVDYHKEKLFFALLVFPTCPLTFGIAKILLFIKTVQQWSSLSIAPLESFKWTIVRILEWSVPIRGFYTMKWYYYFFLDLRWVACVSCEKLSYHVPRAFKTRDLLDTWYSHYSRSRFVVNITFACQSEKRNRKLIRIDGIQKNSSAFTLGCQRVDLACHSLEICFSRCQVRWNVRSVIAMWNRNLQLLLFARALSES